MNKIPFALICWFIFQIACSLSRWTRTERTQPGPFPLYGGCGGRGCWCVGTSSAPPRSHRLLLPQQEERGNVSPRTSLRASPSPPRWGAGLWHSPPQSRAPHSQSPRRAGRQNRTGDKRDALNNLGFFYGIWKPRMISMQRRMHFLQ